MSFRPTALSAAAALAASLVSFAASAAVQPLSGPGTQAGPQAASPSATQGVQQAAGSLSPLRVDFKLLSAMRAGQKVDIVFPSVGRKTVVFEALTTGLDGTRYWHGRLDGSLSDRVYLKQAGKGVVGALRLGTRHINFRQGEGDSLQATAGDAAPVSGQAYALGASGEPGVHDIQGHFADLAQAREGSEISLPLPGGLAEVTVVTHVALDADGFVQIQGVSRLDGLAAPTVITVGTEGVFGTIQTQSGEYQIVTRQGRQQLIDPRGAGWTQLRGDDQVGAHDDDGLHAAAAATAKAGTTATPASTTQPVPLTAGAVDTTINLLMSYGPSYASLWGGEAAARTRLSNLVQTANAAYTNSGTGIQFRIVGWSQLSQADATPQTVLPLLRTGTGVFSGLPALKRSTGAAITVFFSPFNATTGATSTCGLAYVPGANAAGLTAFKSQVAGAVYAALNDGQYNGSYCENLSLAHELGHNLGNAHDKANSGFPGVFSYSYGKGAAGSFGTIMSYISPRVALFSSPQLTCGASKQPCGTSTENVVATMLQTKSVVAALGNAAAASVATTGSTLVSGWLVNANGSPYTGAATVKATQAGVTCTSGSTGLYVCKVPDGVTSLSVSVTAAGKVAAPSVGSFSVQRDTNTPVNGTRFYLSDALASAAQLASK